MDLLPTLSDLNDTDVAEGEEEAMTPTVLPTSPVPFIPTVSTQSAASQAPLDRRRCVTGRVGNKIVLPNGKTRRKATLFLVESFLHSPLMCRSGFDTTPGTITRVGGISQSHV